MFRRESRGAPDWGGGSDHRQDQEVGRGVQVQEGGLGWVRPTDDGKFDPILPSRLEQKCINYGPAALPVPASPGQSGAANCKQQKFLKLKMFSWWRGRTRSKLKTPPRPVRKWEESPKIVKTRLTKAQKKVSSINPIQIVGIVALQRKMFFNNFSWNLTTLKAFSFF